MTESIEPGQLGVVAVLGFQRRRLLREDSVSLRRGKFAQFGRRELGRLLNDGRHKAHQFVKDVERTVSQITARETGKGDR